MKYRTDENDGPGTLKIQLQIPSFRKPNTKVDKFSVQDTGWLEAVLKIENQFVRNWQLKELIPLRLRNHQLGFSDLMFYRTDIAPNSMITHIFLNGARL